MAESCRGPLLMLAGRIRRRLAWLAAWSWLARSAWLPALVVVALVVAERVAAPPPWLAALVPLVVGPWVLSGIVVGCLARGDTSRALALVDRRCATREVLLSAWHLGAGPATPWTELHEGRARALLATLPTPAQILPASRDLRPLAVALACLAFLMPRPEAAPAGSSTVAVGSEARSRAAEVAGDLAAVIAELGEPTADAALEELRDGFRKSLEAARLALEVEEGDRRRFLEGLDVALRDLEQRLEAADAVWNAALAAALQAQVDTSALGEAMAARDAEALAAALEELADKLAADPSGAERRRLLRSLRRALEESGADGELAEALSGLAAALASDDPATALTAARALADAARGLADRQELLARMRELARDLRQRQQGLFREDGGLQALDPEQLARLRPALEGELPLVDGEGLPWGEGPVHLGPARFGVLPAPADGSHLVPVPGMAPGAARIPIPGMAAPQAGVPGALQPGHERPSHGSTNAGHGTATLDGGHRVELPPGGAVTVAAPMHAAPGTEVREVAGTMHGEQARQERTAVVLSRLQAEEEALAEESLPLSRRDQVLRYFSALRRSFDDHGD